MKTSRMFAVILAVSLLSATARSFAAADEYDDSQSNPLRIAAYLVYPAAFLVEWTIFRPFHWLVSATETQEAIFGHTPHPPVLAEPQPFYDYGVTPRRAMIQAEQEVKPVVPQASPEPAKTTEA